MKEYWEEFEWGAFVCDHCESNVSGLPICPCEKNFVKYQIGIPRMQDDKQENERKRNLLFNFAAKKMIPQSYL